MLILQQQCLQTGISAKRSRRRSWTSEYLFDCSLDCAALSRAPKRPRNTQDMKYTTIAPAPRKPKKSRYIPPEILLNVFSHLSQPELVSAGRACKQWYQIASDPLFWRDLNLSKLRGCRFILPPGLIHRISSCRSIHIENPALLPSDAIQRILQQSQSSPHLTKLTLISVLRVPPRILNNLLRCSNSRLTHLTLSKTCCATDEVIAAAVQIHGETLVHLDLEFSTMTDRSLLYIQKHATNLQHLGLAGCLSLSRLRLHTFLASFLPQTLTSIDLRWLVSIRIMTLRKILHESTGQSLRGELPGQESPPPCRSKVVKIDVRGCDKLSVMDLGRLREEFTGVVVLDTAFAVEEAVRWREEFMGVGRGRWGSAGNGDGHVATA